MRGMHKQTPRRRILSNSLIQRILRAAHCRWVGNGCYSAGNSPGALSEHTPGKESQVDPMVGFSPRSRVPAEIAMNALPTTENMKNRTYAILVGAVICLAAVSPSHAMSSLVSLSIQPDWPTNSTPGNVLIYKVNAVVRDGSGLLEVSLSSLGLPDGATVSFSPATLRFTGNAITNQTAIMTVVCAQLTPLDNYPFTITGTSLRGAVTITNQVVLEPYAPFVNRAILNLDRVSNGGVRLRGKGTMGQAYKIEAASTLTNPNWTEVGSSTADGNGRFTVFTNQVANASLRFYRALETAP
jgi:hypothetical protein